MTPATPHTGGTTHRVEADVAAACAVFSWGIGNVIIKMLDAGSIALGFHRFWIASLVTGAALTVRQRRMSLSDLRVAAPSGVAFALNVVCLFTALKVTTVANAAVIVALQPVAVTVIARRRFHERVRPTDIAVLLVAIGGVALVVFGSTGLPEWRLAGDLIAFVSVGTWTWYFVASKEARRRLDTLQHQTTVAIVGAVVLAPVLLVSGQAVVLNGAGTWVGVLLLVLIPGGGHFLLSWAHRYTSLTLTSLLTLGTPVVSTVGAAVVLDEHVAVLQAAGIVVVLTSLGLLFVRSPGFASRPRGRS